MKKTRVYALSAVALGLASIATPLIAAASDPIAPTRASAQPPKQKKSFTWRGSAQVKCTNGECKFVTDAGAGVAYDVGSARFQADAAFRREASKQGTIVEGTLSISISGSF